MLTVDQNIDEVKLSGGKAVKRIGKRPVRVSRTTHPKIKKTATVMVWRKLEPVWC